MASPSTVGPMICQCGETAWVRAAPTIVTLTDAEDLLFLQKHRSIRGKGYPTDCKGRALHRALCPPQDESLTVDHKNRNRADCRKSNLRVCTFQQNQWNRGPQKGSASKFKGVSPMVNGWRAEIMVDGRAIYLGYYRDQRDAARAYDEAAKRLHGEFAYLNFREAA